jgi:hypothetical protein
MGYRKASGLTKRGQIWHLNKQFRGVCVFRLMVDRISRPTWTLIPAQRGQNSGLIVDSFWGEPQ